MASPYIVINISELRQEAIEQLAGKMLKIKAKKGRGALFSDYFTGEELWQTTPGTWTPVDDAVFEYVTTNTTYRFVRISNLPETEAKADAEKANEKKRKICEYIEQMKVNPTASSAASPQKTSETIDIVVENKTFTHKDIHYGDGYDRTVFEFNRELTEGEFVMFLTANNYKIHDPAGWWDDCSKIEGYGNKWTYTWVRKYTD